MAAPNLTLAFTCGLGQALGMVIYIHMSAATESAITIDAQPGHSLAQAIWLSGRVPPLPLCGGLGRCGRCRVRFVSPAPPPLPVEEAYFSPAELAAGWRLACRRQVPKDRTTLTLELVPEHLAFPKDQTHEKEVPGTPGIPNAVPLPELVLAVDLGTTSVYWRALQAGNGVMVAQGHSLNPQCGAGADVMSRLAVARTPEGCHALARLVQALLRHILNNLEAQGLGCVTQICLAANTAMTDIFCEKPVDGLCVAPYTLTYKGNETVKMPHLPPVFLPPLPAPFVGGDVSAGVAFLLTKALPRPFVLADMGTNGELALLTCENQLWLTSVPLGPAMEGIGPECGQMAGPGVVTAFTLGPSGLNAVLHPDSLPKAAHTVLGISATGYLSLLAILLRAGLLDGMGHFVTAPPMPLARRLAQGLAQSKDGSSLRLALPHGLWLSSADVEDMLKVKAAFAMALEALLSHAGLAASDLAVLCLAGAMGEHVAPDDLITLGFVPPALGQRIRAVGNTSLAGACRLALHRKERAHIADLCDHARLLCLVDTPDFQNVYLRHMRLGA